MRFKKFLETGGYYDNMDDTRPTGSGRQQEMPGLTMVPSQNQLRGTVVNITRNGQISMSIQGLDKEATVNIPTSRFEKDRETAPQIGDTVNVIFDRNKRLTDYKVIHRKT